MQQHYTENIAVPLGLLFNIKVMTDKRVLEAYLGIRHSLCFYGPF